MNVLQKNMTTIWPHLDLVGTVQLIDQRFLPHRLVIESVDSAEVMAQAIENMHVRGAPLIGVAAAFGVAIAAHRIMENNANDENWRNLLDATISRLAKTRPTAVNLFWALQKQRNVLDASDSLVAVKNALWNAALVIMAQDIDACRNIGVHGLRLIQEIAERKRAQGNSDAVVQILTHCNAGWLACVDYGTATSPMYMAHDSGIKIHVWVDETRPRNQGAKLTAWELGQHGVPHTLIPDNAGGHLMQHGQVDLVIVGADRVTRTGDVANKIGTYLKALAAKDNGIPFYVALPNSTLDGNLQDGLSEIPIEARGSEEVRYMDGLLSSGEIAEVLICPESTPALNYGFDVTPARLVTGLITNRGICAATEADITSLFPEI
jgi:methylthioribose-1-phosphate isomerase